MESTFYEKVYTAIEKDDVNALDALRQEGNPGAVRFGRFPALSVVYLLGAGKIAKKYEEDLVKITSFIDAPEPSDLSAAFRKKAGKAMRLYLEETVSPVEMLVILGETKKATALFPIARPTVAQKERIDKIYSMLFDSEVTYQAGGVVFAKRPMTARRKKRIILSAVSAFLCVALCVATPFVVNVFVPFIGIGNEQNAEVTDPENTVPGGETDVPGAETPEPGTGESEQDSGNEAKEVTKFVSVSSPEQLDLAASDTRYTLENDLVLPDLSDKTVSCELDGNGHTVTAATYPLFSGITGSVENVVFTVTGDREIEDDFAFLATKNTGAIKNVQATISGAFTVTATPEEGGETSFAGLVVENGGTMENCTVTLSLTITGTVATNATFAGVCSVNNGTMTSCMSSGSVTADTCDLAGVCATNNSTLSQCKNGADLSQTTVEQKWSPVVAGVSATNNGILSGCANEGAITLTDNYLTDGEITDSAQAHAAGIVAKNFTPPSSTGFFYLPIVSLSSCENSGKITANTKECYTFASGVCGYNEYMTSFSECINGGEIVASSDRSIVFAAGIAAYSRSSNSLSVTSCSNADTADITVSLPIADLPNCWTLVAGIVGYGDSVTVTSCTNAGDLNVNTQNGAFYVGGIAARANGVSSSENNGKVSASGRYTTACAGGVAAWSNSVSNSKNNADVTVDGSGTNAYVAGGAAVVGSLSYSENHGKITSVAVCENAYGGGLASSLSGSSYNNLNDGEVSFAGATVSTNVGGITGNATGAVYICKNASPVTVSGSGVNNVGGIVGKTTATVSRCANTASAVVTVSGNNETLSAVGGVCGQSANTVEYSHNQGNVNGTSGKAYVGGILGYSTHNLVGQRVYLGIVENSVAKGTVSVHATAESYAYAGGVCGYVEEKKYNEGTENETYFAGNVKNTFWLGTMESNGNVHKGAIVGASGKNVVLKENETHYEGNYYTSSDDAIGVYLNGEEVLEGDNNGAESVSEEYITGNETYQNILNVLASLLGVQPEQEEPTPEPTPDPVTDDPNTVVT